MNDNLEARTVTVTKLSEERDRTLHKQEKLSNGWEPLE